ncbi:pentapeptide repeat-containing protein [Lachnoanaerobaculum saburreum]|jgi:pentapeptide repeat protein|uniref:Pentapeptide repeat protein n=1 Tax=Lachnoanaerobaculum saburreum TaxID=467210 RepID=A0A133ZGE3_9FIRM|nr:pentapeptide repeat-containing protein [Lachnoanaerobaculum saburreum]KXB54518.1 pentapeptide repeat protein [Lachnoanaerobaculum saburreum]DAO21394.1 MAG TPA: pentapeptide repeat protein [Caudoviricetes sp.]
MKKELKEVLNKNFANMDLRGWSFKGQNLSGANFEGADLEGACFIDAILVSTNFEGASLKNTDFSCANAWDANFNNTNCKDALFLSANLTEASFEGADLDGASFVQANLTEANLQDTNIITAEFDNTVGIYPVCPTHGSFTGWTIVENEEQEFIAMLSIPAYARRNSGTTRKCRADTAVVVDIQSLEGEHVAALVTKLKYRNIKFTVGESVHDNHFEADRFKVSSTDLYFYITKEEALAQARKCI